MHGYSDRINHALAFAAKRLADLLAKLMAEYESRHGELK